jgi:hypothetical protein
MKFFIYPATVALALTMGAGAFAAECTEQARMQAQKTPETMKVFTDACGKAGDSNINKNGAAGTGNSGAARSSAPTVGTGINSGPNVPGTNDTNSAVMPSDKSGTGGGMSGSGTSGGGTTGNNGTGTGTGTGTGGASGGGTSR